MKNFKNMVIGMLLGLIIIGVVGVTKVKATDRAINTYKELSNNISHSSKTYMINKLNNNGNIKVFLNDESSIVYIKDDNKIDLANCINTHLGE